MYTLPFNTSLLICWINVVCWITSESTLNKFEFQTHINTSTVHHHYYDKCWHDTLAQLSDVLPSLVISGALVPSRLTPYQLWMRNERKRQFPNCKRAQLTSFLWSPSALQTNTSVEVQICFGSHQPARSFRNGRKMRFFERAIFDKFWWSTPPALRFLPFSCLFLAPARPFRRPWVDGDQTKKLPEWTQKRIHRANASADGSTHDMITNIHPFISQLSSVHIVETSHTTFSRAFIHRVSTCTINNHLKQQASMLHLREA